MALCGIGCKLCIIGVALIGFQSVVLILGAAVHGCVGVCVCVRVCACLSERVHVAWPAMCMGLF